MKTTKEIEITKTISFYLCDCCGEKIPDDEIWQGFNSPKITLYSEIEKNRESYDICGKCWKELIKNFKHKDKKNENE